MRAQIEPVAHAARARIVREAVRLPGNAEEVHIDPEISAQTRETGVAGAEPKTKVGEPILALGDRELLLDARGRTIACCHVVVVVDVERTTRFRRLEIVVRRAPKEVEAGLNSKVGEPIRCEQVELATRLEGCRIGIARLRNAGRTNRRRSRIGPAHSGDTAANESTHAGVIRGHPHAEIQLLEGLEHETCATTCLNRR